MWTGYTCFGKPTAEAACYHPLYSCELLLLLLPSTWSVYSLQHLHNSSAEYCSSWCYTSNRRHRRGRKAVARLGIKARSSYYKVSAWFQTPGSFSITYHAIASFKGKECFCQKNPNTSPRNCLFQTIIKTTFDRLFGFLSKLRTLWPFGRKESTSNPQSKLSWFRQG